MIPTDSVIWPVFAFVWGALWGSFVNVVVHRVPLGESVVSPGSRCGSCRTPIRWYHNLPILSWLLLRGRCATCRAPFSVRYLLVEAAVGALSAAVWVKLATPAHGPPPLLADLLIAWFGLFIFVADLVAIALIDLDTMRIPDALSLPPIVLGLLLALTASHVTGVTLEESILGAVIGGGTLLLVTWSYFAITKREGMGLGDYRLLAMVGAFLGWRSLLFLLVASALQGIVFAVVARVAKLELPDPGPDDEEDEVEEQEAEGSEPLPAPEPSFRHMAIPFGPFIVLAALEWLVLEPYLMALFDRWILHPRA